MTKHETAVSMIESRFHALTTGESSIQLHAEVGMAVEMAYALNVIDCGEHKHFVERQHRIHQREHDEFMIKIRRSA